MTSLRLLIIIVLLVSTLTGCAASAPRFTSSRTVIVAADEDAVGDPEGTPGGEATPDEGARTVDRNELLRAVSGYLGSPYKYGGNEEEGMDCSAFVRTVFSDLYSITLPRSAREQFREGKSVKKKNLVPGDLVFFNTRGRRASHVGIYLGDDEFAHVSVNEGVTITSMANPYFAKRYSGARRILH